MSKINVGIVGAAGYSGTELLKRLINHPNINITVITSQTNQGLKLSKLNPYFKNKLDIEFNAFNPQELKEKCDAIFFATPSGTAMKLAHHFYDSSIKLIDISGDFRLLSNEDYVKWYKIEHYDPKALKNWVYGLSEIFTKQVKNAKYLSNPGCYPTSILLGLLPILKIDKPKQPIICDCKSGISGKGKKLSPNSLYVSCNENTMAYKITGHQHIPEIERAIHTFTNKKQTISFTPHIVPMDRGILSTIYISLSSASINDKTIRDYYNKFYSSSIFVKVLPEEELPQTKNLTMTNECHISVKMDERTGILKIISAIDNLVKGAAGSAIQNFNLMFSLNETTSLI